MAENTTSEGKEEVLQQRRTRIEYLALIAEIVSAIAVVISLGFVGLQLRGGNTVMLRNESNATMAQWSTFRASVYTDRDTAMIFQSGMDATPPLDAADRLRFLYLMREHDWATFQIWDRARKGLVPDANFRMGAAPDYLRVICTPGGAAAWAEIKAELPEPYVADMDGLAVSYAQTRGVVCQPAAE